MPIISRGAAYVDPAGDLVAADPGFRGLLGLPERDPGPRLRQLAEAQPALRALLAGRGPGEVAIAGARAELLLRRHPGVGGGALLLVHRAADALLLELGSAAAWLGPLVSGMAHDVKNPLNAMVLQLALLGEKLEADRAAAGPHLSALSEQVGRVDRAVRRFGDLVDPPPAASGLDAAALIGDVVSLFGHQALRGRVALALEVAHRPAPLAVDAGRTTRLLVALFGSALDDCPEGGRLVARLRVEAATVVLELEHTPGRGDPGAGLGYDVMEELAAATARALGGTLRRERTGDRRRTVVGLPRGEAE
jgi:signal transduction histidine kinase